LVSQAPYSTEMLRIDRHGEPTATQCGGISRTTTLPAPITERCPIRTPPKMSDPAPIQTPSSITIGFELPFPADFGPATAISWLPERIVTRGAISQWLPMLIEASPPPIST